MLIILGKFSSINVRKVLWTCDEIALAFQREDWDSGFRDTATPDFLRLNPNGLVPVIVDDDLVLWESHTIIRYLATRYGTPDLLPTEPRERARIEMWMDWQATEFNNSWRYAFQVLVRNNPAFDDVTELRASLCAWARNIAILDAQLARTNHFIGGERSRSPTFRSGLRSIAGS